MSVRAAWHAAPLVLTGVTLLASGCGSGSSGRPATPVPGLPRVTLILRHSGADHQLLACSIVHHYARFTARRPIVFEGNLQPREHASHFKIKIKIKRCVDGHFQDSGSWDIRGGRNGRFQGMLPIPGKGIYFARARYRNDVGTATSDKVYFDVA
ncbi:hypothetical protein NBH00_12915 [Paraconexibacter antarcticus]|uniref:Gliding motility-associated lipoprotein GldH n=1 Tax=Paraconexibacter antarcticus TaxID=2949664 RepID=A0ABY5E2U6_9ACTN|nr:hypothetical protein [Paraconexibacter antarcticus]UTI67125.1 hypothetical protein NBH00_12915 [Paraconexibacter antarcticus]